MAASETRSADEPEDCSAAVPAARLDALTPLPSSSSTVQNPPSSPRTPVSPPTDLAPPLEARQALPLACDSSNEQQRLREEQLEAEWKTSADKWPRWLPPLLSWTLQVVKDEPEPLVSPEMLLIIDALALQPEEVERVRWMHKRDEEQLAKPDKTPMDAYRRGALERRVKARYNDTLIILDAWDKYVEFERENGVKSMERIRARLSRFAPDWFSTLKARNEAERLLDYPEGID